MRRARPLVLLLFALAGCAAPGGPLVDHERVEMTPNGGWTMERFTLSEGATVRYDTQTRNDGAYDVCLVPRADEDAWKDGRTLMGRACNTEVTRAVDAAALPPGEYVLALRCREPSTRCIVSVTLSVD